MTTTDPDGPVDDALIRELDERTIEQIAAGEVVERPASAVKELVENSLDAGASRVDVAVEAGGIERILVRDDGVGMTRAGVRKAVQQHTTSKLGDVSDLAGGIETLGFRGEALSTIAAVSRMTIRSRPQGADQGAELVVSGGEIQSVEAVGCPAGTVVEVADLFYNTPARREFLHSEATEFDHVNRVVGNYSLANPEVAISLTHEDRETFATTGQGSLEGAIMAVWGREVAEGMVPVSETYDSGPLRAIEGLVSDPEVNRSRPRYVTTFVDGRYVTAGVLRDAIIDGYGRQLAPDRYPFAVVDCTVAPGSVDVNVHPRKLEVRFGDPDVVADRVETAVETALREADLLRTTAPRGRGAPDETTLGIDQGDSAAEGTTRPPRSSAGSGAHRSGEATGTVRGATDQRTLTTGTSGPETDRLPSVEILGQYDDTYIVAATEDGLILIDQHAADERIHYERLLDRFRETGATQQLLEPVAVSVTPDEAEALATLGAALESVGFEVTTTADRTVEVTAVPTILETNVDPALLREAIAGILERLDPEAPVQTAAEQVLADLACYPAVTGHTPLAAGSIVALVEALDACEDPTSCPHGRPTIVRIDEAELEARFERDYPGHAVRRRDHD